MGTAEAREAKWREFHARNPHVYELLREKALAAVRRGRKHIGIRMVWELMRWDLTVQTTSGDDFKLNDHYTSFYARELMAREPELAGVFETRGGAANEEQEPTQRGLWEECA